MDDNATADAPRPGTSLNRPMTKGGPDQSMRPMTRCGSVLCSSASARVSTTHESGGGDSIVMEKCSPSSWCFDRDSFVVCLESACGDTVPSVLVDADLHRYLYSVLDRSGCSLVQLNTLH